MEVLTEGSKIPRGSLGVWKLAWPSIITNLFYATSSIIAIKVVGNLGPDAIAAAVTGQRVTFIVQAILTGVLAGSTALIARNWGAKNYAEVSIYFTSHTLYIPITYNVVLQKLKGYLHDL